MGLPIKKRIAPLLQMSKDDCNVASGLDILLSVIDSRLMENRDFSCPSSLVAKAADESITSKASIGTNGAQSHGKIKNQEDDFDEDSIEESARSLSSPVAASSQQRRHVMVGSTSFDSTRRNKRSKIFPEILMDILSNPDYAHIIGWSPTGRSFVILDTPLFSSQILPKYFRRVVFRSFVRKLNRWGFRSMRRSSEEGRLESNYSAPRFEHKHFSRDEPEMCVKIFCKSNPGASKRILHAKQIDGQDSGDDTSLAGDDGLPGGANDAVVITPIENATSILSAAPVAAATTVVSHPPLKQLHTTGGVGGLLPRPAPSHQQNNDEFRTFSNECILMDLQWRRHQALMNRVRMMQMSSNPDILSQVIAEKWQQMMLLNGGSR
ncbi:hypothetical protein ACHAXA_011048 [Cyclostephanos tholiformis]|uniref:HSF-type DNA-binding domain-containing protein n=1 Tax=Cyclostephanos tholiformis TaxID=382380 RepID=A0ABD3RYV3_9STRA